MTLFPSIDDRAARKMQWMVFAKLRFFFPLLLAGATLAAQTVASIRTAQTAIQIKAGDEYPTLSSVGTGTGAPWKNTAPEKLIDTVSIGNRQQPLRWKLNRTQSHSEPNRAVFVYESQSPKLQLEWSWNAPSNSGPIEHTIRIRNLDAQELWLPLQPSFQSTFDLSSKAALQHAYIEKGAGKPSDEGTHLVSAPVGYQWKGSSGTYAHPMEGEPREIIPFQAVSNGNSGWYIGIEFSGRTRLTLNRTNDTLATVVGLNPEPGPFRTRLRPNETFEAPIVFLGAYKGDIDALGNQLRPWVREVLGNARAWSNPQYPLLVNNSWGSGMQINEPLALKMIRDSAELGLEMFHIDAGWFRGVGDWYPDPKKFPHGLAPIADNAHQHGLKFGLWVDWTQAGLDAEPGALNLRNAKVHDWTVSDLPADWKPQEFKGQTIDIGVPAAHEYAKREVFRIFESYHLDMLEHDGYLVAQGCVRTDHPHAPPDPAQLQTLKQDGSYIVLGANSTDVSYHAVNAYYDIYKSLRQRHPDSLLEVCNDGGRMVDFGSAAHADYFSITDTYDPLSNRRAFYDASHLLPAAMLESYVEKWPVPKIENFRYMLRSGMQGWLTIMLDTNAWTPEQHAVAKEEIQLYKDKLRPLIRDAQIYHVAPRPDGIHWDGTEFFDPKTGRGVLYAFHGSNQNDSKHSFRLRGVATDRTYRVTFHDHTVPDRTATGQQLLSDGLALELKLPHSSEIVYLEEVK